MKVNYHLSATAHLHLLVSLLSFSGRERKLHYIRISDVKLHSNMVLIYIYEFGITKVTPLHVFLLCLCSSTEADIKGEDKKRLLCGPE